jgi:ketosteroid isomerase-like protein
MSLTLWSFKQENESSKKEDLPKAATVKELGQMNRDFAKALTAKDAVAAVRVYHENAPILPPSEPIVKGRANIQAY